MSIAQFAGFAGRSIAVSSPKCSVTFMLSLRD